jgi:hypothetical protein
MESAIHCELAPDPAACREGWGDGYFNFPTQAERGQAYTRELNDLVNLKSSNGDYPIAGIAWWTWTDMDGANAEYMNFGLLTVSDNAYDGKEAIIARSTDPLGVSHRR